MPYPRLRRSVIALAGALLALGVVAIAPVGPATVLAIPTANPPGGDEAEQAIPAAISEIRLAWLLRLFVNHDFRRPWFVGRDEYAEQTAAMADALATPAASAWVQRQRAEVAAQLLNTLRDDYQKWLEQELRGDFQPLSSIEPAALSVALAPRDRLRFLSVFPVESSTALNLRPLFYLAETTLAVPIVRVTTLGTEGLSQRTLVRPSVAPEYVLALIERAIQHIADQLGDRDGDGLADRVETYNRARGFNPDLPNVEISVYRLLHVVTHCFADLLFPRDRLLLDACWPDSGVGYYHFRPGEPVDTDTHASLTTLSALHEVTRIWFVLFPFGPRLGIGDISRAGGGRFPPHSGHRAGQDVDLRYLAGQDYEGRLNLATLQSRLYEPAVNQLLVNLMLVRDDLDLVFADRRSQLQDRFASGRLHFIGGHEHHLHLRFR